MCSLCTEEKTFSPPYVHVIMGKRDDRPCIASLHSMQIAYTLQEMFQLQTKSYSFNKFVTDIVVTVLAIKCDSTQ